jgi:hypothetical protein
VPWIVCQNSVARDTPQQPTVFESRPPGAVRSYKAAPVAPTSVRVHRANNQFNAINLIAPLGALNGIKNSSANRVTGRIGTQCRTAIVRQATPSFATNSSTESQALQLGVESFYAYARRDLASHNRKKSFNVLRIGPGGEALLNNQC